MLDSHVLDSLMIAKKILYELATARRYSYSYSYNCTRSTAHCDLGSSAELPPAVDDAINCFTLHISCVSLQHQTRYDISYVNSELCES